MEEREGEPGLSVGCHPADPFAPPPDDAGIQRRVAAIRDLADGLRLACVAHREECARPRKRLELVAALCVALLCEAFGGAACRRATPRSAGQDALSTFRLPEGFQIEIAAA